MKNKISLFVLLLSAVLGSSAWAGGGDDTAKELSKKCPPPRPPHDPKPPEDPRAMAAAAPASFPSDVPNSREIIKAIKRSLGVRDEHGYYNVEGKVRHDNTTYGFNVYVTKNGLASLETVEFHPPSRIDGKLRYVVQPHPHPHPPQFFLSIDRNGTLEHDTVVLFLR